MGLYLKIEINSDLILSPITSRIHNMSLLAVLRHLYIIYINLHKSYYIKPIHKLA